MFHIEWVILEINMKALIRQHLILSYLTFVYSELRHAKICLRGFRLIWTKSGINLDPNNIFPVHQNSFVLSEYLILVVVVGEHLVRITPKPQP